jgi:transposase
MWKPEHRVAADRRGLRYPSDLIDAEWALVSSLIPPARRGGRKRSVDVREVLNAIFYVLSTGCQWKALPKDLPPKSTAHFYLMLWDWDGTLERIHDALYVATRQAAGREASPTAAIIDSQSAKAGSKRGSAIDPQGFDAGKKVTGRKRHILVDTLGLLLGVSILPADIKNRDGSLALLHETRRRFPFVERIFADAGYQGPKMANVVASSGRWKIYIVRRSDLRRFVVLPKR